MVTKQELGEQLKSLLASESDIVKISRWAFRLYSNNRQNLDPSMEEILECLFSIEDDPQFEYPYDELQQLAKKLIDEGEKEELCDPISGIKDRASDLGYNWLMCPICQEAWEDHSIYGMVRCPKCNSKLHNPKHNKKK
jgi:DNA-directed RNA polymerase subunit RPC12/RpoP